MKTKLLFIFCMTILLIGSGGCGDWACENFKLFCPKDLIIKPEVNTIEDIKDAKKIVIESSNTIEKASSEIATEANKITTEATNAQSKIPDNVKAEINPHMISIKKSSAAILEDTTTINKASARLDGAKSLLDGAGKKVVIVETALNKIAKERDAAVKAQKKAEADRASQLHRTLQWLIAGCIVGCGAFIALFFFTGSKGGLIAAGGCGLVLVIAIFVDLYITWLAIGGGVLLLAMVGWLLYNIYVKNKAFSQVVETVEVAKTGLSEDKKEELFGKNGQTGIMDSVQNPTTINLVKKEKSKMSLWNSMKNKK